jgi:hypothetical protein
MLKPKRREHIAVKLSAPDNLSVLRHDSWTGHYMYRPTQYPARNDLCRRPNRTYAGRDDYVGIENN